MLEQSIIPKKLLRNLTVINQFDQLDQFDEFIKNCFMCTS